MRVYSTWTTPKRGGPRLKPVSFHPTTFRPSFILKDSGIPLTSIRCGDLSNVRKVPKLAHRLDRVLFQPLNYHFLQDPRSSVYNFNPYLQNLIPLKELNQKLLEGTFVPSEKDKNLLKLCQEHKTNFYTSTSAVTGILSHMHFLLSNMKGINGDVLSKNFKEKRFRFTKGATIPGVVLAMRKDTEGPDCPFSKRRYAIGADHSADNEIVLSLMGHFMERLLVCPPEIYNQFRADSKVPFEKVKETFHGESVYNFSKISNFILRSQLDCQDQRLPNGNKSFDIKTRAVCAVRHDISHVERDEYTGYQIVRAHDQYESFEREFYELMRSTMLKYSLQARIGNMDGIFVAYHNIEKVFGFQYLPLEEIDYILHSDTLESTLNTKNDVQDQDKIMGPLGTHTPDLKRILSTKIANTEYKFSMEIINRILCRILNKKSDPNVTLSDNYRIVFKTGKFKKKVYLFVLASPIDEQMVQRIQNVSKEISNTTLDKQIDIEKLLSGDNDSSESPLNEDLLKKNYKSFEHRKMVREINQKTSENAFGYRISVDHLFNGKHSKMAHPMPTSLDDDWALNTYVTSVRPSLAKFLYLKFLKEKEDICWRSLYDNETESEPDSEIYKEDDLSDSNSEIRSEADKMELHLRELAKDTEPSQYQQLLRAFGGKGRLREEKYRQKPPKHIQLVK